MCTDGYTDKLTDANRFYNLSCAMCYSYWADNNNCSITVALATKDNSESANFHHG